jgi:hypothetical protein
MLPGLVAIIFFISFFLLGYIGITEQYASWSIIFEKWIPAAISPASAGIFLVLLVPWVNHFYWKRRTHRERQWSDEKVKYEVLSNTAEILSGALLYISRLAELKEEESSVNEDMKADVRNEMHIIHQNKLEIERRIAKEKRLIELFFDESISLQMSKWIKGYNRVRLTKKIPFKPSDKLPRRTKEILVAMRNEIISERDD